jgi:hypothetical protein
MFSGEQAVADEAVDYPVQCTHGCALAVWSMPESEAARWTCQAAAWDKHQCHATDREQ